MKLLSVLIRLWVFLLHVPRWIWSKLRRRRPSVYRAEIVEEFPDRLQPFVIYLAGEPACLWGAAMSCPCGCGDPIELNLLKQVRPRWSATVHADKVASLHPSVWRSKGCKSHFFVRNGKIDWC